MNIIFKQAIFMFMSLMSMTFYKRVICHYLVSGHSHMVPDRVISHVKRSFGTNDMYLPEEMITKMNTISTVTGEFLDHNDPCRLLFTGWERILKEHFIPIPAIENGYTKNHFYEFADGQVTMRQTVGSEVKYVHNYVAEGTNRIIKNSVLSKILGSVTLENATFQDIILPRHPVGNFPQSKVISLSEKYFTIPEEMLYYYPKLADLQNDYQESLDPKEKANIRALNTVAMVKRKRGSDTSAAINLPAAVPMKAGRKKVAVVVLPISKSILRFMQISKETNVTKVAVMAKLETPR